MRLNRFDYALILEKRQRPHASKGSHFIRELTIYQGNQRIRFSRTAGQAPAPESEKTIKLHRPFTGKPAAGLPAPPQAHKRAVRKASQTRSVDAGIAQMDKELKATADEMSAKKEITRTNLAR